MPEWDRVRLDQAPGGEQILSGHCGADRAGAVGHIETKGIGLGVEARREDLVPVRIRSHIRSRGSGEDHAQDRRERPREEHGSRTSAQESISALP